MSVVDRALEMEAPQAARAKLLDELAPFLKKTDIQNRIYGNDVLIAVYSRAGMKSSGGILISDTYREDEFQGITGLILAMGPLASPENPAFERWFGNHPPQVGDWIGFSVKDGSIFKVGSVTCRSIEWKFLRFGTLVPDAVM